MVIREIIYILNREDGEVKVEERCYYFWLSLCLLILIKYFFRLKLL